MGVARKDNNLGLREIGGVVNVLITFKSTFLHFVCITNQIYVTVPYEGLNFLITA